MHESVFEEHEEAARTKGWAIYELNGDIHVVPAGDGKEHLEKCWCRPAEEEGMWVHNSLDGRELYETKPPS